MKRYLRSFLPTANSISARERVRTAVGGLVGILVTGVLSRTWLGDAATLPALIAPMGASAVLLFAVPASPLAQPWSIIGGNCIAGLVGVTAARVLHDPLLAAAVAEGCAIALMMLFRCVHPPSGAVALTAVLGGSAISQLGYGFVLWPVAANSVLLLGAALVFNNLTGRRYPHVGGDLVSAHTKRETPLRSDLSDLDAVLVDVDQLLDIDRGDLAAILRRVQLRTAEHDEGGATCGEVMVRAVIGVAPQSSLAEAVKLLRHSEFAMLPVTDEAARVIGTVTASDLLANTSWTRAMPRLSLSRRLRLTIEQGRAPHGSIEDVMRRAIPAIHPSTPVAKAATAMAQAGVHHLPVTDSDGRLLGGIAQTDVMLALLAATPARSAEPATV